MMRSILATAEAETNSELPYTCTAQGGSRETGVCQSWPMETFLGWYTFVVKAEERETFPAQDLV